MNDTMPRVCTAVEQVSGLSRLCETDRSLNALFLGNDYHGVDLQVQKSQIPGAGLGLVSMTQIGQDEEIFWKEQFCIVDDNHLPITCDNCLQWMGRSIDANGRMCKFGQSGLQVRFCARCKVVSYCTKVSAAPLPCLPTLGTDETLITDMSFRPVRKWPGLLTISMNVDFWRSRKWAL